jgi:hypothetical protein
MRNLRKFGAALLLAGVLGSGVVATTMPVLAADTTTTTQLSEFCNKLNQFITWLESQPPSSLRDLVLQYARAICARYCQTCS